MPDQGEIHIVPTAPCVPTITPLEAYGAPRTRSASFSGRKSDPKSVLSDAPTSRGRPPSPARQSDRVPPAANNDTRMSRSNKNVKRRPAKGTADTSNGTDIPAIPLPEPAPQRDPARRPGRGRGRRNAKSQENAQKGTPLSDWLTSAKRADQDRANLPTTAPISAPELRSPSWADEDPDEPDEQFSDFVSDASTPSPSTDGYTTPVAEKVKAAASECVDI